MEHKSLFLLLLMSVFFSSQAAIDYFWHVTDFHMDQNYSTNGNAALMCWSRSKEGPLPDGPLGDYRCDSPYTLVRSAVKAMRHLGPEPAFILWTGDDKAHMPDTYFSDDIVIDLIANLTETITSQFPGVPLVPVLGNHDWYPTHNIPPYKDELYTRIAALWKDYLGDSVPSTFLAGGHYSILLPNKIRFIGLNTVFYYKKNKSIKLQQMPDPAAQFAWFENILNNSRAAGEKVYVASHVPPGVFERHIQPQGFRWFQPPYNQCYIKLVNKYSDVIIAQFFAHQHTDSFRIFYNERGEPSSYILLAPSVTPWNTTLSEVGPNNPGLRKIFYDKDTGEITNFEQYFLNLTKANLANDSSVNQWQLEYSLTSAYSIDPPITASKLHKIAQTFATNNRTLFNKYYLYNSVSYQSPEECDTICKNYQYCCITKVDFEEFERCRKQIANNKGNNSGSNAWTMVGSSISLIFFLLVTAY